MRQKTLFFSLFNVVALSVVGIVLVGMLRVSNTTTSLKTSLGPVQGYTPGEKDGVRPPVVPNMTYHGGPVMAGVVNVYLILWEPPGIAIDPNYNRLIGRYYNDVGGSGLYDINQQYAGFNGAPVSAVIRGVWLDNTRADAYPRGILLSPLAIALEVQRAMRVNGWAPGISNYFPVYTSPTVGTTTPFCAYHNFINANPPTIFSHVVYPSEYYSRCQIQIRGWISPNNCVVCDSAISISAHEQFEAATDPLGTGWFYMSTAGEIGDLCQLTYGPLTLDQGKANQEWNNAFYTIQMMWDNAQRSCQQSA